ncbi:zinc-binding dehydrogenase [Nonomuraea angiospora]|uniref:zinc-binding dehydrogenase n=1 Tax=Nonomuraea angiospora TaxID=46172 RepID=UPI00343EF716
MQLDKAETVVVSAAAGGVGSLAVQLARRAGATVIGLASQYNHEWLQSHGVIPVVYGDGVIDRIKAAAPSGIDAFIDTHGGGYVELALALGVAVERIDTIADSFTRCRASAGSRFTPAGTRVPPVAASSAFDSPSSARTGRTVL